MLSAAEYMGKAAISASKSWVEYISLALNMAGKMLERRTYSGTWKLVLISQIYFTAIQILPLFLTVSIIIGFLLTGIFLQILRDLGLAEYLGRIIMGFVVTELSPFITVQLVALRSSSAMNAEIATMKINKELHALEMFGIDIVSYLFLPRIISGVISISLLSGIFSIVVLLTGLICSNLIFGMSADTYAYLLLSSAKLSDILIIAVKCFTFGFFITIIPIRSGLNATEDLTSIPMAVLNGMVKVFIAIIVIEVITLAVRFI